MFSRFSKKVFSRAVLVALALSLLSFTVAFAASGDLDSTFGDGGKVTMDVSGNRFDVVNALAIQSNGRIVVAGEYYNASFTVGDFVVARYKSSGSLDTSFSGDGKLTTSFGGIDEGKDIAIQSDGKIVVSGQKCHNDWVCDLAVARYKMDGTLDAAFGSSGKKTVAFGSDDNGTYGGIAIQSDGKIVIGGYMTNNQGNLDFAVYRLKTNGTLDTSFGGAGKVSFGFGAGRVDAANDLVLQGSKIIVVGRTCDETDSVCDFAVARLNSNGSLDTTFSGDGLLTTNFGASETAAAAALQSDGKLVVAGNKILLSGTQLCAVARYKSNGSLDTTFNSNGKKAIATGYGCNGIVLTSTRIILSTSIAKTGNHDFWVVRLKSNGSLDTAFSGDGIAAIDFGGVDIPLDIAMQSDGKYVLAGATTFDGQRDFAVARVLP